MRMVIISLAALLLASCASSPTEPPSGPASSGMTAEVTARWAASCALCHVRGEGGAPRSGDVDAWAPRVAQGFETLMQHTIEGYNSMPPLGYCMACERADFEAMIRFMAGGS